ncbi:MAG: hypothetical protein NVS2B12_15670 [Ktedonobacteraceae bacterium]
MDIIAITPTQQLLLILLAFLLAWMITFAWLAIRKAPEATVERKEVAYYRPTKVAATVLHLEAAKDVPESVATAATAATHETAQARGIYLEQSVR